MLGICSYGFYIPKYRIKTESIASVWGKNYLDIINSLGIEEKAVGGVDEDALTMAFESASMALSGFEAKKKEIKTVFFGSETAPYAVNPTSTILAEFLGIEKNYSAYDTEFACKAATGALISTFGMIKSGYGNYGLVVASDKGVAKPHDPLEYTAASGSVSLLVGKTDPILELVDFYSFSSDTPDFWRREGIRYPSHGGRFSGKPSYFYHIEQAVRSIIKKNKLTQADFSHVIFHMPNSKFPKKAACILGFSETQLENSLVSNYLGNSYTASSLMGLVAVLEKAKKDQLILLASYGSGAGSDAFIFRITKNLEKRRHNFQKMIKEKKYIDYTAYLKFLEII